MSFYFFAGYGREGFTNAGVEESQIFVDLGGGAYGGAGLREVVFCSMAMAGGMPRM